MTTVVGLVDWWSVVDMAVVAVVAYVVFLFIRQTRSFIVFSAIVALVGVNYLATTFNLALTRQLFQPLLTFILVIFVVVFQKEIRRFFEWLWWPGHRPVWLRYGHVPDSNLPRLLATTAEQLAERKIGALLVLAGREAWEPVVQGGFPLEGRLSGPLLLSIFDPTSPGHDGASVIEDGRLKAFGVHLPLGENFNYQTNLGTRHRAAVGMSERTDALILVVSEERGVISLARGGQLTPVSSIETLEQELAKFMSHDQNPTVSPGRYFLTHNWGLKIAALVVAVGLWWVASSQAGVVNREIEVPLEFQGVRSGLMIAETGPTDVRVALSGSSRDLRLLDPQTINLRVDVSALGAGYHVLVLTPEAVGRPPYASVREVSPRQTWVRIAPAAER